MNVRRTERAVASLEAEHARSLAMVLAAAVTAVALIHVGVERHQ
jgi:hypothetical protein